VKGWRSDVLGKLHAPEGVSIEKNASAGAPASASTATATCTGQDAVPEGKVYSIAAGAFQGMAVLAPRAP
jgi:hypothetical protein